MANMKPKRGTVYVLLSYWFVLIAEILPTVYFRRSNAIRPEKKSTLEARARLCLFDHLLSESNYHRFPLSAFILGKAAST